ncbi:D-galactose 1-dehydrogenase/L-arabinose 1- dehydrogenase [Sphingopyxis italica]|uniref:D-galactose 1-dehydrogenase/L-arabinose 1-dehydrogenase n=2 Tax=Sphingopyxis italica TaxID=1129133 RepID=A0A7X6B811_9SPHN|nr:Gfo/Idh/MocA family oxidoreductase [Sphingopyxis italica]NJB88292.1 D-galactose 1-dehydrogenase/L-arabinose 1- dehydrogenase [Sphingopyxis italica]
MMIRLGLVGIGKIARDQHLPAIRADDRYELVATASRHAQLDGVPGHVDIAAMIAGDHRLGAVSICTPPVGRHAIAAAAIDAGLHVMLEKPPAATTTEISALADYARARGVTLFATWHSREAAGVGPARDWLSDKRIRAAHIRWKEDIRRWHPGQEWILDAGGFGVFDPGINALSIMAAILPAPLLLDAAQIDIPEGRGSPIAATMAMRSGDAEVTADLDFLQTGPQSWDIEVETDAGTLRLSMGGSVLELPGGEPVTREDREYPRLYTRFAELIAAGKSDVDIRPLQLVADAFLVAERRTVAPFQF